MADYEFPDELIAIQRRFFEAEEKLRTAEGEAFTEAFRDQQEAVILKSRHPFWESVKDNRHKADMALREAARAGDQAGE